MAEKLKRHFKLGTTSFIYPDHILPNVEKLAPFFDEIELLVFESLPEEVLPSKNDVKDLLSVAQDTGLTYNIHLPTDISLTDNSPEKRKQSAGGYLKTIERLAPLQPTSHTLHLEMPTALKKDIGRPETQRKDQLQNQLRIWIENTYDGLKRLLAGGVSPDILSIETLDYPFSLVEPLVEEFNLPVCIDLGHAIKYGYDLNTIFIAHAPNIPVMHLHGVEFSEEKIKDHTRLDLMPENDFAKILKVLEIYTGVVSLEVFNLDNLNYSLAFLSRFFSEIPFEEAL